MTNTLFLALDSRQIAKKISQAVRYVCYAAPGIFDKPAQALAEFAKRTGVESVSVNLDFDEHVLRMGFGSLSAVKKLRDSGIQVMTKSGLRTGLFVVDGDGYIFAPTPRLLESEPSSSNAPNAMRLSSDQVTDALARFSKETKEIAIHSVGSDRDRDRIGALPIDVKPTMVSKDQVERVDKRLQEAPPVKFDLARQVRVYNAYLQYVEIRLVGAAIQRHRVPLSPKLVGLSAGSDIARRLKTTFDLIEKSDTLSSKSLENELNEIRKAFTPSLGKKHGRVLLKSMKAAFESKLQDFRKKLEDHGQRLKEELNEDLDKSRKQIVDHCLPQVMKSPPPSLEGQLPKITADGARRFLDHELRRTFPSVDAITREMRLDVQYKDITFETLKDDSFLKSIKDAFPAHDWDRAHAEFRAAGETRH